MTRTSQEIAEAALPGWKAERQSRRTDAGVVRRVDCGTPDLAALRRRYLGEVPEADLGLSPASSMMEDDTEYVVLHPLEGDRTASRVVVVSRGRAVAIQG